MPYPRNWLEERPRAPIRDTPPHYRERKTISAILAVLYASGRIAARILWMVLIPVIFIAWIGYHLVRWLSGSRSP